MLTGECLLSESVFAAFNSVCFPFTGLVDTEEHGVCERVIAHLDLDCFYAQVERNRLRIDPSRPLAVQQWGSLIAGQC